MIHSIKEIIKFIERSPFLIICYKIILIFSAAGLIHFALNKSLKHLIKLIFKYYRQLEQNLLEEIAKSIRSPWLLLNWGLAIIFCLEVITAKSLISFKYFTLVLSISWLILRTLEQTEKYLITFVYIGEQKIYRRNKTSIIAVNRILKMVLIIVTILLSMQAFSINITGIVALGGAGTIVLGIAAKELLANFFGGIMIFMDRQFIVGDSIKAASQGIEGKVEYIGWRLTRIRTLENALLYVPNSAFLTMSVENSSKRYTRRIKEIIRFKYKDLNKIAKVLADIQATLKNHPDLDPKEMCFIGIYQFNYLAVDCLLCCFTRAVDLEAYLKVQHDILYKISEVLSRYDIEIAFTAPADSYNPNINNVLSSSTPKE